MKAPIVLILGQATADDVLSKDQFKDMTFHFYPSDNNLDQVLAVHRPNVIISVGPDWTKFGRLATSPYQVRCKWYHISKIDDLTRETLMANYIRGVEPQDDNNPLVDVITTSYKSGDKILRVFSSLRRQVYKNWKWYILDDSPEDHTETFELLKKLKSKDYRIEIFKMDKNCGIIGEVKHYVSSLGVGQVILEMDHDDVITPDCLQRVVEAFKEHPEVGFVYTDFCELHYGSNIPVNYNKTASFGYLGYSAEKYNGYTVYHGVTPRQNNLTVRHIVAMPNHTRCWRRSVYQELGGHRGFHVADDYDLCVRTFLKTRMLHIPYMCYLQYRNSEEDGGNFTFIRNQEIQKIVKLISDHYHDQITQRFIELGCPESPPHDYFTPVWERDRYFQEPHVTLYMPKEKDKVSVIIPTYKRCHNGDLDRAIHSVLNQTYQNFELIIIGDNCPDMMHHIDRNYNHPAIRWWNLPDNFNDSGATPRNYALRLLVRTEYVAYLDDDNTWDANHLESLMKALKEAEADYAFSSFILDDQIPIICRQPRLYRIDTSAILHKYELVEQYGYWKSGREQYSHDWELVSRWVEGGQPYAYTALPTVHYRVDPKRCNPKGLYEVYGDQDPPTLG